MTLEYSARHQRLFLTPLCRQFTQSCTSLGVNDGRGCFDLVRRHHGAHVGFDVLARVDLLGRQAKPLALSIDGLHAGHGFVKLSVLLFHFAFGEIELWHVLYT